MPYSHYTGNDMSSDIEKKLIKDRNDGLSRCCLPILVVLLVVCLVSCGMLSYFFIQLFNEFREIKRIDARRVDTLNPGLGQQIKSSESLTSIEELNTVFQALIKQICDFTSSTPTTTEGHPRLEKRQANPEDVIPPYLDIAAMFQGSWSAMSTQVQESLDDLNAAVESELESMKLLVEESVRGFESRFHLINEQIEIAHTSLAAQIGENSRLIHVFGRRPTNASRIRPHQFRNLTSHLQQSDLARGNFTYHNLEERLATLESCFINDCPSGVDNSGESAAVPVYYISDPDLIELPIRDQSAEIRSPNYPEVYDNSKVYTWKLAWNTQRNYQTLTVTFMDFAVEGEDFADADCKYDYLTMSVNDRPYCGRFKNRSEYYSYTLPYELNFNVSAISEVDMVFRTDDSIYDTGFKFVYRLS